MVLTTLIDLTGAVGWVAILAPYFILLVVGIAAFAGRDPSQASVPQVDARPEATSAAPATPAAPATSTQRTLRTEPAVPPTASMRAPQPSAKPVTVPWATPSPPAVPSITTNALELALADAEQRFDDAAVAKLSLEMAQRLLADGQSDSFAATHLRRAIILASRLGDTATHAAARLELGDLVAGQGDMTTACEHWQIARQIFWDGGESQMLAEADRRMIANGCPTDWVLNDF